LHKTTAQIVMATGNAGKLREISALLSNSGVEVVAQSALDVEPAEETGDTFEANALLKARNAARQTGLAAIADDSGLVVDALDGRPGVRSARYAGVHASDAENIVKLLRELRNVKNRAAHFHCAAVFVRHADDRSPLVAEACWYGEISAVQKGNAGFGYDPVFFDPELGLTGAELSAEQKNAVSHRGQAIRRLAGMMTAQMRGQV
jgi:XTP/dITP diphosphohydrolase